MSYSRREIGVPSMLATGAGAVAAALSVAAGVAACWPFPHAAIINANAATVAIRIHGVLENWLIWSSTQKKKRLWPFGRRARGRQFSVNNAISPIFDAFCGGRVICCIAAIRRLLG